jgi:hypothetical protein
LIVGVALYTSIGTFDFLSVPANLIFWAKEEGFNKSFSTATGMDEKHNGVIECGIFRHDSNASVGK